MWDITVKLRPIPSSARNPQGSRESIAMDLEKYGHVQYVEISEMDTAEQMQIGGKNDFIRK